MCSSQYQSKYPTPDISHMSAGDYEHVYEPAEDSFLLMDALEKDEELVKSIRPTICLEIGSGSGVVITFLASILGKGAMYLCTDINPKACMISRTTAVQNGASLEPVVTDLVSGLSERLKEKVDMLLFNPPYVVTSSNEIAKGSLEYTWAGGTHGREVMDRLFPLVPQLLSDSGIFYLVTVKENKPEEILELMKSLGLEGSNILSRRSGPEHLSILRFQKK